MVPSTMREKVVIAAERTRAGFIGHYLKLEDYPVKLKLIVAAAALTAFVIPAFAADTYYVVQDAKTKKCTITEMKPTSTETTVVSGETVYKTKVEAESGMKTIKVCSSN